MHVPIPMLAAAAILFVLLALLAFRRRAGPRHLMRPPAGLSGEEKRPKPVELPPELAEAVRALLRDRRKIAAIKRVREATGLGLAEAKSLVERM